MATPLKMENVQVIEDNHQLLENGVKISETYLWCEPLTDEKDIAEIRRHLLLTQIPFVQAKFDTCLYDKERKLEFYRRVTGIFVPKEYIYGA